LYGEGIKTFAFIGPVLPMKVHKLVRMLQGLITYVHVDRMNYSNKVKHVYRKYNWEYYLSDEYFSHVYDVVGSSFHIN
jgi:hypothetical protein